jgi:DNA-directed RNA polymerase subunit RPC12/RpoP
MSELIFTISVPTDGGFLGRECNASACGRYFRVHAESIKPSMHCPYCGAFFPNDQMHTQSQVHYLQEAGMEKAREYAYGELDKMFSELSGSFRGNSSFTFRHNAINYRAKAVLPRYREQKVDTELHCPDCGFLFQVYGIFGYCPGCRTENMMIYDANLAIIEREIAGSADATRSLRHAYDDLVSTFEQYCQKKAPEADDRPRSFQDIFAVRHFFKKHKSADILELLTEEQLMCIRRVFQKRHAYQHSEGRITDQYIKKMPEDASLLGTQALLSIEEFRQAALILKDVLMRLY